MRKKKRLSLKIYNKLNKISSFLWIILGLGIIGFGIYYKEIFEKIFGAFAILIGINRLRNRFNKTISIKKYELGRIYFLSLMLIIYSLVNPLANIAILFDIYKRDWVIRGGLDEKE